MRTEEEIKKRGRRYTEKLKTADGDLKYMFENKIEELEWVLNKSYVPQIVYKSYGDNFWLCLRHYIRLKKRKPNPIHEEKIEPSKDTYPIVCAFCKFG